MIKDADTTLEDALAKRGYGCVCGVDEVGRGPWAGPVLACAVILPAEGISGLRDSKTLGRARRARLASAILEVGTAALGAASVAEIERLNILQASLLAMRRAVLRLPVRPDVALIDGRFAPRGLPCPAHCVVKGDEKSASIAAAAIVAKEARDGLMRKLDARWPGYGWASNAGYGVPAHRSGLETLGPTPHHRRSFRPVARFF